MYKGIVKVFRESESVATTDGYGQIKMRDPRTPEEKAKKPSGKLLEVEVMASTQDGLVRKISAMLATLGDDE